MGRLEISMRCMEIRNLLEAGELEQAYELAENLDIERVTSVVDLKVIASVYERMGQYEDALDVLHRSYEKKPTKMVVYRLAYLCVKTENFEDAEFFYREFVNMAPNSPDKYILRYGIDRAKGVDYYIRIATLQELKSMDYREEWGYELAKVYHKAGLYEDCVRECDDLILWFGEGVIVEKAKLLKKYHTEGKASLDAYGVFDKNLTPEQVEHNREKFRYDTQDLSRQIKEMTSTENDYQLKNDLERDLEKTIDLRKAMIEDTEALDLLGREVHRSWGSATPTQGGEVIQIKKLRAKNQQTGFWKRKKNSPDMEEILAEEEEQDKDALPSEEDWEIRESVAVQPKFQASKLQEELAKEIARFNEDDTEDKGFVEDYEQHSFYEQQTTREIPVQKEESFYEEGISEETFYEEENALEEEIPEEAFLEEENALEEEIPEETFYEEENISEEENQEEESFHGQESIPEEEKIFYEEENNQDQEEEIPAYVQRDRKTASADIFHEIEDETKETTGEIRTMNIFRSLLGGRKNNKQKEKKNSIEDTEQDKTEEIDQTPEPVSENLRQGEARVNVVKVKSTTEKDKKKASTTKTLLNEKEEPAGTGVVRRYMGKKTEDTKPEYEKTVDEPNEESMEPVTEEETQEPIVNMKDVWDLFPQYQQNTRICEGLLAFLQGVFGEKGFRNVIITSKSADVAQTLCTDIADVLYGYGIIEKAEVTTLSAEELNKMHLEQNYEQVQGGVMHITSARKITPDTAQSIMNMVEELRKNVIVVLNDGKPYMDDFMNEYKIMQRYFPYWVIL